MKRFLIILVSLAMAIVGCARPKDENNGQVFTLYPTVTFTPIPTMTFTFSQAPTLISDKAYSRFLDLLLGKGGCSLPCWWGIRPGKSSASEAKDILFPLSGIAKYPDFSSIGHGGFLISYPSGDTEVHLLLAYSSSFNDNAIDVIYVDTQAFHKQNITNSNQDRSFYGSATYNKLLSTYTLQGMLSAFGPPSDVFLFVDKLDAEPNAPNFFTIRLSYPDEGIFVKYSTPLETKDGNYLGCPTKSFITLWLLSPQTRLGYQDALSKISDWTDVFPIKYAKTLEDVTQMTIYDFYRTFNQPTDVCIETPIVKWPSH